MQSSSTASDSRGFEVITMLFILDAPTAGFVHIKKSESFAPAWLVSLASGFR